MFSSGLCFCAPQRLLVKKMNKIPTLILLLTSGCIYSEQHYTVPTTAGAVPVTDSSLSYHRRGRTKKQMVVPDALRAQLALYRAQHTFFPLTLAGLAASSDSARLAVERLAAAGFEMAELEDGGRADSVVLRTIFITTHHAVTTKSVRSADGISVNQQSEVVEPAVEKARIEARFSYVLNATGAVALRRLQ
jgi:hypothetical protein